MKILRSMETENLSAQMLDYGGSLYRRREFKDGRGVEWMEVDRHGIKTKVSESRTESLERAWQREEHEEA
jgi:hypothetical protein